MDFFPGPQVKHDILLLLVVANVIQKKLATIAAFYLIKGLHG